MNKRIRVIAFDADDTLWVNEPYFRNAELAFCELMKDILPSDQVMELLFRTEIDNLKWYGYGIKGFILSMIQILHQISGETIASSRLAAVMEIGANMYKQPLVLLPGVEQVLKALVNDYRLVVATKGDLLDQERKLARSGLAPYIHHIEIMSDKQEQDYLKLLKHLDCEPEAFLMIGNSLKSDILPVLAIGAHAIHIPYEITWQHEQVEDEIQHERFKKLERIESILEQIANEN